MDIATEVAKSKIEMGKAVFDPARERSSSTTRQPRTRALRGPDHHTVPPPHEHEQGRAAALHQRAQGHHGVAKARATAAALTHPFPRRPPSPARRVEGAYSQIAACKLFDARYCLL
ncbi:MAG: hypothetical protein ACLU37_03055 [Collinsella sp.]